MNPHPYNDLLRRLADSARRFPTDIEAASLGAMADRCRMEVAASMVEDRHPAAAELLRHHGRWVDRQLLLLWCRALGRAQGVTWDEC